MRPISVSLALALATVVLTNASAQAQCVTAVTPVSVRGVAPFRAGAAVAWSGSRFGVVTVDETSGNALHFRTYASDLQSRTLDTEIAPLSFDGPITLQWTGSEFGVFYLDPQRRVMFQRLTEIGQAIGPPMHILQSFFFFNTSEYDFVWDPVRRAYLAVHTLPSSTTSSLHVSVIDLDGSTRSTQLVTSFVGNPATPRIAVNNRGTFAIIYQRDQARTLLNYGVFGTDNLQKAGGLILTGRDPRIATDGDRFAIVALNPTPTPKQFRWAIVNDDGTIAMTERTLFTTTSIDVAPVGLIWNPTWQEWGYTYLDAKFGFNFLPGELRLRRFTPAGALIADANFSPEFPTVHFGAEHPAVWTGSAYVSVLSSFISPTLRTESYLAVSCPLAARIEVPREALTPNERLTFNGVATGGAPDYTYRWDFGDGSREETGQFIVHAFPATGNYTVTLRVTDAAGTTTTTTMTIRVVISKRRALKR